MPQPFVLSRLPSGPFTVTAEKGPEGQRVYRKELVYPGHFVKKDSRGRVEFELPVDDTLIDHWVATFQKMKDNGVEVPLPIEHTTDPEQRRGTVVDLRKEWNPERKANALYAYTVFRDDDAEKLSSTTNVSLFSPPDFVDGKGNKYVRPIRHVALTDYPLIPGLGKFEAVAASLTLSLSEETGQMTFADLAEQMGLEVPEGAADDEIGQMIIDAWNEGGDEEEMPPMDDFEEGLEEDPLGDMDDDMGEEEMGFADDEMMPEEEDDEEEEEAPMASVSASVVKMVSRNRVAELDRLAREGKITPAVSGKLKQRYATQQSVTFALSSEARGGAGDDYDAVVAALSLNGSVYPTGERSGPQGQRNAKNPLVADAERRAKKLKSR